jgi:hypothetical protein
MNYFETILLNSGLSWFISKLLPYILSLALGLVLFLLAKKFLKNKKWKSFILIPLLFIPFLVYFIQYPIYEGDFSNNSKTVNTAIELGNENELIVVAIPNCPFCFESIAKLKRVKQRIPEAQIQFLVCTENENDLQTYKIESQGLFEIKKISNYEDLAIMVDNKFPSFILLKENQQVQIWNNSAFGVSAIDEVEGFIGR